MEALPKENDSAQILKQQDSSLTKDNESQTERFVKILGIHWDVIRDEFQFDLSELIKYAESLPVTKRSVLK